MIQAHDRSGSNSLLRQIEAVASRLTLLHAGAILHPTMNEIAERRYGRVIAAQLASLAIRGHLWFSYGGDYVGSKGMLATRHPNPPDVPEREEQRLMDILFGGAETVRLARDRSGGGQEWDELTAMIHRWLKDTGLGWMRLDRYRVLRTLLRLKKAMHEHAQMLSRKPGWQWSNAPGLYKAGYPFAVLFSMESGPLRWPDMPEEELFIPSLLPEACNLAIWNAD